MNALSPMLTISKIIASFAMKNGFAGDVTDGDMTDKVADYAEVAADELEIITGCPVAREDLIGAELILAAKADDILYDREQADISERPGSVQMSVNGLVAWYARP